MLPFTDAGALYLTLNSFFSEGGLNFWVFELHTESLKILKIISRIGITSHHLMLMNNLKNLTIPPECMCLKYPIIERFIINVRMYDFTSEKEDN